MKRILSRPIFALLALLFVFSGCRGVGYLPFGTSFAMKCDQRYSKGVNRPLFHEAKIAADPEKAVVVLYRLFIKRCGDSRDMEGVRTIYIDGKQAVEHLNDDYFTALQIDPKKVRFSAERKGGLFSRDGGKLEMTPEAGKTYFLRWSKVGLWDCKKCFQIVDKKNAYKELEGVMYLAPQAFKAPVFYKGKSL